MLVCILQGMVSGHNAVFELPARSKQYWYIQQKEKWVHLHIAICMLSYENVMLCMCGQLRDLVGGEQVAC